MDRLRRPADPRTAALIRAAQASARSRGSFQPSRRTMLGAGALGLGATLLAGCAPPEPPTSGTGGMPELTLPEDVSDTDKNVRWANWTAYLDMDDAGKTYPTLTAFEKQTGIKVVYDTYDNNEIVETKLLAGKSGYDIVVPSGPFVQRLIGAKVFTK